MNALTRHRKIAMDLDGTLIDGVAAVALGDFVRECHEHKSFFIVTFRTAEQMQTVQQELAAYDLSPDFFARIIPMPTRYVLEFDEDQRFRRTARMPRLDQVAPDAQLPGEFKFTHWKGFIVHKLGATVLVDDMPYLVLPGCEKFHITFIDAKSMA